MINEVEMFTLEKAGVNFEIILERFSNNTNVYLSFVQKFIKDKSYNLFFEYYKKGEFDKAANEIHNIKGISGNLGFKNLFDSSTVILEVLRNKNHDEMNNLNELVNKFKADYEQLEMLINNRRY